jgi:multiple sugar transport system permease protein
MSGSPVGSESRPRARQASRRLRAPAFWLFVGPFLAGLTAFTFVPIAWGFVLSFFRARATATPTQFIGLDNYIVLLTSSAFQQALLTGVAFTIFIVPLSFAGALGLALMVHRLPVLSGASRSVFFLPAACSYVVGSLIWKMNIFNGLPFGLANSVLATFHVGPFAWIGTVSPPLYWVVLVTVRLWLQLGAFMIIFIAGIQEIPRPLYEAAAVDGARPGWQTFRHVTWPLLRNTSVAVGLLLAIGAVQAFDEFYNVFAGLSTGAGQGTAGSFLVRPPMVYLFNVAFTDADLGRGAAGTFIVTAVVVLFVIVPARRLGFGREQRL